MTRLIGLVLVFVFYSAALYASQAGFVGTVRDQRGNPVPGATIRAVPEARGATLIAVADQNGQFQLALEARPYQVLITSDGFVALSERVIPSATNSQSVVFVMQVTGVSETVRVEAPFARGSATVSSALKTTALLRDTPQAVTVIPASMIAEQRMQSMADVVRYMPGVGMAQGEGNRDTPILRGNSSTGDFYVDGVRDDAQYFRDTYNVDRIEAIKGPNAMIFGRGGGGGVINRVTRQAGWSPIREVDAQLGSFDNRRLAVDLGTATQSRVAFRVTGVYEVADSYRQHVELERAGVNPTMAIALGSKTMLRAGYEYFRDHRTADRGVPSFNGRPVQTDPSTFFGDPDKSTSRADVNLASVSIEHNLTPGVNLRSRTTYAVYDKFYQNIFPGAVINDLVSLSGYNNATNRRNFFNQTDAILTKQTGAITHVVATGLELGRQLTDNFRSTAFFPTIGANTTSVLAPLSAPVTSLPVQFRQNATDADNFGRATIAAVYAQDQITLTSHLQAVVGLRFDSFNVDFSNRRSGATFSSRDDLLSPRAGLIFKPVVPLSIYTSYSVAYIPRAGDQLSSLSLSNQALDPEEFRNLEVGAKWELRSIAFSLAGYRLNRGNVAIADPVDPTRSLLIDAQRTKGVEASVDGRVNDRWTVTGGYAFQDGKITRSISATAQAGSVLAQVPRHSFSLWNKYDFGRGVGAGVGIVRRDDIFAASDNLITLPAFTRIDGALFWTVTQRIRAQVNVENLTNTNYFASAHNNANILPGSPRAVRAAVTTRF